MGERSIIGVVAAAGRGTRLAGGYYWSILPKAMLPVAGQPLICYALQTLEALGVSEVYVILSSNDRITPRFLASNRIGKCSLKVVIQQRPRGLADAVYLLRNRIHEPFYLVLGDDVTITSGLDRFHTALLRPGVVAVQGVVREAHISRIREACGVDLDTRGRIKRIVEKPSSGNYRYRGIGIYGLSPQIFSRIRQTTRHPSGELRLTDTLSLLAREGALAGFIVRGRNVNINTPLDRDQAELVLLRTRGTTSS